MRNTLTEVEKFYIERNYNEMSMEKIADKISDVEPSTIRAYILNLPAFPSKDDTVQVRHEKIRQTNMKAGDFFDTSTQNTKDGRGVVKLTPQSAEISDANYPDTPHVRHPNKITRLKN